MEQIQQRRWHTAVVIYFCFFGMGLAALLARMPEVKENLGVNSSQLGFLLLVGATGSLISLILAGKVVARFGTKPVLTISYVAMGVFLIATTLAIESHSVFATVSFLFLAMAGYAFADVAVNVDGSAIEQKLNRSVLPRMHAGYSLGSFAGAAIGSVSVSVGISLSTQTWLTAALATLVPVIVNRFVPKHTGQDLHHKDSAAEKVKTKSPWTNPTVVLLGLGILGATITEGAGNDWMALSFKEGLGASATNAAIAFVVYQVGMTTTRFFGGGFVDKFGRRRMLEILALTGVAGILLVILTNNIYIGWIGCALWGAGVALGFPLFISAAGEGENAAKKVSAVAAFGYGAFLIGPPTLGLLAQNIGILNMLYVLVFALAFAAFFARATEAKA